MAHIKLKSTDQQKKDRGAEIRQVEISEPDQLLSLIKKNRKSKKIAQKEISTFANISLTSVGEIERGEVDVKLSNLLKILNLCGINLYAEYTE